MWDADAKSDASQSSEQPDALCSQHIERLARSVDRLALSMDALSAALTQFMMALNPDEEQTSLDGEQPMTDLAGRPITS